MSTLPASKSRSGLSDASSEKGGPATPRSARKVGRSGSLRSDPSSPFQMARPRTSSAEASPRSVNSKPASERRFSKFTTTPPDVLTLHKQPKAMLANVAGLDLQSQLDAAREELKKIKEKLVAAENNRDEILKELNVVKKLADDTNEKLQEALVAKKRAEDATEIEKFRADELEQLGIDAAQKREEEWQSELENIQNLHATDAGELLSAKEEVMKLRRELALVTDAKNAALGHADEAMKIAEGNAERVEFLSAEVNRLRTSLDSSLERKSLETSELVKQLESEISVLKCEIEKASGFKRKMLEVEATLEEFKSELADARRSESDAVRDLNEWKRQAEIVELKLEEANTSVNSKMDSLSAAMKELEESSFLLQEKESEIVSLQAKVENLQLELDNGKAELEESVRHSNMLLQELSNVKTTAEDLKRKLQDSEEAKLEATSNQKVANSKYEILLEEKSTLISELEMARKDKADMMKAMEDLAAAFEEVSVRERETHEKYLNKETEHKLIVTEIEELKLSLKNCKESYGVMLDEANYEIVCLQKTVERLELDSAKIKELSDSKEQNMSATKKQSEEEISVLKSELEKALASYRSKDQDAVAASEEREQLLAKLRNAELAVAEANGLLEEVKLETVRLKDRLLDKENELQSITQENDDLRTREAAATEKIAELTLLLTEAAENKQENNTEQPSSHLETNSAKEPEDVHSESEPPSTNNENGHKSDIADEDQEKSHADTNSELPAEAEDGLRVPTDQAHSIACVPTKEPLPPEKKNKPLLKRFGSLLKKKSGHK